MRSPCALLALLAACDCSSATGPDASVDAFVRDAFVVDAFVPTDRGLPEPWMCPVGSCCPPVENRTDRSERDSQLRRDLDRAQSALVACIGGEDCAEALVTVDASGVVDTAVAQPPSDTPDDQTCVEDALLGLCLPSLVGMGEQSVRLCGI